MKILFSALLLFVTVYSFCQPADSASVNGYLRKNMEVLNLTKQLPIPFFDKAFLSNKLFLFGENHGSSNPQIVDVMLFKQLYTMAGVRYYIAEVDMIKAWMLNNFMKDGKDKWLQKVFASWVADTAQWANKSNYNKFYALRAFYTSLPAKDKFIFLGVDAIQDYSLLKEYTAYLFSNTHHMVGKPWLDSLKNITDTISYKERKSLGAFAARLSAQLKNNTTNLNKNAVTNAAALQHYIASLSFSGAGMYRDSMMYRNLKSLIDAYGLQDKKMYGFLGFYHCLQASYEKSMPFAAQLKHNSTLFDGKIISIQMLAVQSKTLLPYMAQIKQMMPLAYAQKLRSENADFTQSTKYIPFDLSNDAPMMKVNGIENLKAVTLPESTVIFKLNNAESPYARCKLLGEVTGFQNVQLTSAASTTTDAFQYVILFRDSKAGVPVE